MLFLAMAKYEESIGKLIRKVRKALKLTQDKLSESVGVTPKYIQYLEAGKRNPSLKTLRKIAKNLGKSVKDFLPD